MVSKAELPCLQPLLLLLQTACQPCPDNRITAYVPGDGSCQNSITDCKIPPGYGVFSADANNPFEPTTRTANLRAEKCPVGYFGAGDTAAGQLTRNTLCTKCP
jgi:hypothetical protein